LAQDSLSLREAARLALRENKAISATNAGMRASAARIDEARAGRLPKLNYSESFSRSDNPVFVFSSLLTQHQFGVENFNIGPLNRPDSLNNFQSQLTVDQAVRRRADSQRGEIGRSLAADDRRRAAPHPDASDCRRGQSLLRRGPGG
jgi:outer membrane protein TolC